MSNNKMRNFIIIGISQLLNLFALIALLPYIKGIIPVVDYNELIFIIVVLQGLLCFNPISNVFLRGLNKKDIFIDDVRSLNAFLCIYVYIPILFLWFISYSSGFEEHIYLFFILAFLVLVKLFFERSVLVYCNNVSKAVFKIATFQVLPLISMVFLPSANIFVIYISVFTMFFYTTRLIVDLAKVYLTIKYLLTNIRSEFIFSLTSLAQSNADKYFIPMIFSKSELASYFLAVMIPSRLIAIYSNISNVYSRDIFKYKSFLFFKKYISYSLPLYFLLSFLLFYFSDYIVMSYLGLDERYKYIYYFSLIVSGIQVFGFINYQYFSAFNIINTYTVLNFISCFIFIISLYILQVGFDIGLLSIPISLIFSKLLEPIGSLVVFFLVKKRSLN